LGISMDAAGVNCRGCPAARAANGDSASEAVKQNNELFMRFSLVRLKLDQNSAVIPVSRSRNFSVFGLWYGIYVGNLNRS
jgi:hypothetical protein